MTESLQKEYVQEEFKKMKTKNDNKTCADCLGKNPTWASIPYGILICMECASLHRSFGVHLTFVRSTLLDTWTAKQMKMMHLGGNENARNFFRQHGFEDQIDGGKLSQKYNSKAAELYRNKLKRMVEGGEEEKKTSYLKEQFQEKPNEEKKKPQQKQQQKDDFEDDDDDSDEFVTQKVSEKKSSSSNNSPQINVSKYSSNQKKNTTGISDKKKANVNFDAWDEWDDFDKSSDDEDSDEKSKKNKKNTKGGNNKKSNKKETVIPTRDNPKTYSHSLAYDDDDDQPEKKQEYQSPYQSKKDSNSSNNKNSSNSNEKSRYQRQPTTSSTTSQKSNSSSNSNRYESKTTSYDSSSNAQDRFKNAKSISSDQYFGTDKDITPQRQTKLNQFSSAKSISSSEYFGEEEEQSDFGSNIVETAKSDLNKLTSSLMTGGKKLAEMTKDFFNDFQDRYN